MVRAVLSLSASRRTSNDEREADREHQRTDQRATPGGGHRVRLRRPVRHQGAEARRRRRHHDRARPPTTCSSRCSTRWRPASSPRARSPRRPARCCAGSRTPGCCSARSPTSTSRRARSPRTCSAASTVTPYDSLIVAAGAGQSYFGNDQFAEFAPGMKSIDDALELRGRIFGAFELAELADDPAEAIDRLLTFVVVGAGPTGVEMAGQIAELAHRTLQARLPRASTPATPASSCSTPRRQVLPPFGDQARRARPSRQLERARRRGAARRDGHRRRRARHRGRGQGRHAPPDRRRSPRSGPPASRPARWASMLAEQTGAALDRAGRISVNPDLTLPGPPRGVRGRRHDRARQPARRRAGRHPGRAGTPPRQIKRRLAGQAAAEPVQVLRQGLDGDDLAVPRGRQRSASSGSPASSPG